MRQQEVRGRATRAKGTMQEALGVLTDDRSMERQDLVTRAVGADQEEFGIEHHNGDEVVADKGGKAP